MVGGALLDVWSSKVCVYAVPVILVCVLMLFPHVFLYHGSHSKVVSKIKNFLMIC